MGQLTLNNSTVSNNTAANGDGGGIFNCGASLHAFGLCTGAPGSLTLNYSVVSNNVGGSFDGGGIPNDGQAVMTLNVSIVSGNTTVNNGGGIENKGTATLNFSTVLGNTSSSGGGIENNGTATLNVSVVSNNSSTGGSEFFARRWGAVQRAVQHGSDDTQLFHCASQQCGIRWRRHLCWGGSDADQPQHRDG